MLQRIFKLSENRTHAGRELFAGMATFAAMAYILAVNPQILSAVGMDFGAVVTATALASALMTAVFGLVQKDHDLADEGRGGGMEQAHLGLP